MPAALDRALGRPELETVCRTLTGNRVRVLAYHDVPDPDAFRAQIEHVARHYTPVSGMDVADAVTSGRALPRRAVWLTFDDGRRSVLHHGMPELVRLGVPATLFVCPGLVESQRPFWPVVVEAALARGPVDFDGRTWTDRRLVTHLKTVDDTERRRFVDSLDPGEPDREDVSLNRDELQPWLDAGFELGNHTWDHPCLDRCSPDEQRRQITDAHEWLVELLGRHPRLFAYPNGNLTPHARTVIAELGYEVGVAFDHRLTDLRADPLVMSRLRIDTTSDLPRTRAILGGAHSATFHARERARRVVQR